jgi:hypothetical protein
MNAQKFGLRVASLIFGVACLAHIARLILGIELHIGPYRLGAFSAVLAVIVTAGLCVWFWQLSTCCQQTEAHSPPSGPA